MGLPGHDCRRLLPTNANADLGSLSWQPDQGDPFGPGRDTFRTSGVVSALVFGGPGRDRILTAGGSDQIHAGPGRDFVRAAGSEDTLDGGPGRDLLDGGTGRFDYIDYSSRRRGAVSTSPKTWAERAANGIACRGSSTW